MEISTTPNPRDKKEGDIYSPDNPPWSTPVAVMYLFFSVLAILVFQAAFGFGYAAYNGISPSDNEAFRAFITSPRSLLVQLLAVIPAHLVTLAVGWAIITRGRNYSFRKMLGWEWGGFRWWHLVLIFVGVMALFAGFVQIFGEQENELDRLLKSSRAAVYVVAIMATFSAPIVEEVVYRGVLFSALQRSFNVVSAVIVTTIVFAGVHLMQYWGDFAVILSLVTLSLVLTLLRAITKNLLPCITLYFAFNGIQTASLIVEPWIEPLSNSKTAWIFPL